jgi:hypothetical protein
MSDTLREIEEAIDQLSPSEVHELHAWLRQYHPRSIGIRVQRDSHSGYLDNARAGAVEDEEQGRTTPL